MTSDTMLLLIQESYRQRNLTVDNGLIVCLQLELEVQQVPLIIPEEDGQWVLHKWATCAECEVETWALTYRFRVPTYCVKTQVAGGALIEIVGSRTTSLVAATKKVAALNQAMSASFWVGTLEA